MKTVHIDKIGSVTKNISLEHSVEISENILCEEGAVVVAKVLEDKRIYNQLELPSGRLSTLKKGDVIAVALGNRRALKGFVGTIPKSLCVGDVIHVLNIGGVAGQCVSENVCAVGHAVKIEVLGSVVKNGNPVNIKDSKCFELSSTLDSNTPLIVVSGTCMNVGKTSVASEIISHAVRHGFHIAGTKLAGVACLRDTEKMKDYGATQAVSFLDAGLTSTVEQSGTSVQVAKGAINYLSKANPDFIVIEFGDGVYGEYGVKNILEDPEIAKNITAHIGCAHDPMGAAKLVEVCREIGTPLDVISGPVTDNSVGKKFVRENLETEAFNALYYNEELFNFLLETCLKK